MSKISNQSRKGQQTAEVL